MKSKGFGSLAAFISPPTPIQEVVNQPPPPPLLIRALAKALHIEVSAIESVAVALDTHYIQGAGPGITGYDNDEIGRKSFMGDISGQGCPGSFQDTFFEVTFETTKIGIRGKLHRGTTRDRIFIGLLLRCISLEMGLSYDSQKDKNLIKSAGLDYPEATEELQIIWTRS
jgi:hypothetical protein